MPNKLTRDQILAAKDVPDEWVEVPEWGGCVYVRGLTLGAIKRLGEASADTNEIDTGMKTFVACVVDPETGRPIFTEADLPLLENKGSAPLVRIMEAV